MKHLKIATAIVAVLSGVALAHANTVYQVPLVHTNATGEYQTEVTITQPVATPKTFLSTVDTGSNPLIVPHLPVAASSFKGRFKMSYAGGTKATVHKLDASVHLTGTPSIPMTIGVVAHNVRGRLQPIVGLDPEHSEGVTSFAANFAKHTPAGYQFGLLLCQHNGELDLGGVGPEVNQSTAQSTPFISKDRFSIHPKMLSVTVDGKTHTLGRFPRYSHRTRYVLDSGTTAWNLNAHLFDQVAITLRRYCHQHHIAIAPRFWQPTSQHAFRRGMAFSSNITQRFANFPVFNIVLANGVTLHVKPETYLRQNPSGRYQFMIKRMPHGANIIFGDTVIMNYYIYYDWAQHKAVFYSNQGLCGQVA